MKRAAIDLQCAWRSRIARKELKKLKMTYLEESKSQEIAKLQSTIEKMQAQVEEANSMLVKERETAKIAIHEALPIIKEVAVVDTAKVEKLTNENEELKALVESLEKKADETERKYSQVQRESEERFKLIEDQKSKIDQLQDSLQSLKENPSNMESENQVLRQQALNISMAQDFSEEIEVLEEKVENLESENEALLQK